MKERRTDEQLSAVPKKTAKREREVAPRWAWTEPSVWTERMLDALEKGVKGGKWYSLIDKVYAEETLWAGWGAVKRNGSSAGIDGQTVRQFEREPPTLARISHIDYTASRVSRIRRPKIDASEVPRLLLSQLHLQLHLHIQITQYCRFDSAR